MAVATEKEYLLKEGVAGEMVDGAAVAAAAESGDWAVGSSVHLCELKQFVAAQAARRQPVLLIGEAGLRQPEIARAIHETGGCRSRRFIEVNPLCSGTDEQSEEIFGPQGAIRTCAEGTVFINDFARLPSFRQQQISALLEEQRWRTRADAAVEPRLIMSLTEIDRESYLVCGLIESLRSGAFALKPLRERSEDIPYLAHHLAQRICRRHGREAREFAPTALSALAEYHWPHNIDELEAVLESVIAFSPPPCIDADSLPQQVRYAALREIPATGFDVSEAVEAFEQSLIETALRQASYSQSKAARLLGLRPQTLSMKLKRLKEKNRAMETE